MYLAILGSGPKTEIERHRLGSDGTRASPSREKQQGQTDTGQRRGEGAYAGAEARAGAFFSGKQHGGGLGVTEETFLEAPPAGAPERGGERKRQREGERQNCAFAPTAVAQQDALSHKRQWHGKTLRQEGNKKNTYAFAPTSVAQKDATAKRQQRKIPTCSHQLQWHRKTRWQKRKLSCKRETSKY